jgi:hypothetical protein
MWGGAVPSGANDKGGRAWNRPSHRHEHSRLKKEEPKHLKRMGQIYAADLPRRLISVILI